MTRRNLAPYWIRAHYGGQCSNPECRRGVKKGEDILYFPATKTFLCCYETCGQRAEREIRENAKDAVLWGEI
jgi:hypothetical protein